jgi:hypothetical protein
VTSEISPFTVEQILTAYTLTRTMSVSDSRAIGAALEAIRRHGEDYLKEFEASVRNVDL